MLIFLSFTLLIAGGSLYLHYNIFIASRSFKEDILFTINPGTTARDVLTSLETDDIISNGRVAELYYRLKHNRDSIKAGDYVFSGTLTTKDVIVKLVFGEVLSSEVKIVVPEGYNVFQIANLLENKELIEETKEFTESSQALEGYLFPDTYQFEKDSSVKDIQEKMIENFYKKTENTNYGLESKEDIIVLASLLEKEVATHYDRQIVAGIIRKRLNSGMALQIDATVLYAHTFRKNEAGIGMGVEPNGHNPVSLDDLSLDSSYNTYKYRGLPPGPICNPGIKAISAAINPIKTDYWYYLNTKDGATVFSETYDEHLTNKAKYLK